MLCSMPVLATIWANELERKIAPRSVIIRCGAPCSDMARSSAAVTCAAFGQLTGSGDEPTAVVVDNTKQPKWKEAEHPHKSQINAPELPRSTYSDSSSSVSALCLEPYNLRLIALANLSDGLASEQLGTAISLLPRRPLTNFGNREIQVDIARRCRPEFHAL